jgi:hypothetical protein
MPPEKSENRKQNSHHNAANWEHEEHPRAIQLVILLSQTPHELMKRIGT